MDRGVPSEAVLAEMRTTDPPVQYLVGTPKGRLTRLEKALVAKPWQDARPGVQVKLLPRMANSTSSPKALTGLPRNGRSAAAR